MPLEQVSPGFTDTALHAADINAAIMWGRPWFAEKTIDQNSLLSSTTLVDDNELYGDLPANAKFAMLAWLVTYSAGESSDMKIAFDIPSGSRMSFGIHGLIGSASATTAAPIETVARMNQTTTTTASLNVGVVGDNSVALLGGRLSTGDAGTVQLRWCQAVSSGTAVTLKADSWLWFSRVG